jgi:hypothetical protein
MINQIDDSKCKGTIEAFIEFKNGNKETIKFNNTILRTGRKALALCLANRIGNDFDYFINRMIFGDGGATNSGVPKQVSDSMDSLFGSTLVSRPVVANIDPNNETQVVFTAVIPFDDPSNGSTLNEMALKLNGSPSASGDGLYSMATFAGITKSAQMQITWNWRLSFI